MNQLAAEIRDKLGRDPGPGDLLLELACTRGVAADALAELAVNLDDLAAVVERTRTQHAGRAPTPEEQRLAEEIKRLRAAKEQALGRQQLQRGASLRDEQRRLARQLHPENGLPREALREIRARLRITDPH